ncbi:hypothetical protein BYT27DRAFT_6430824 [Phlegmacium glaucopus]|nr:hypothetical protein BYT27DRAFT_6430824 [Phlegmacium glaucopus]
MPAIAAITLQYNTYQVELDHKATAPIYGQLQYNLLLLFAIVCLATLGQRECRDGNFSYDVSLFSTPPAASCIKVQRIVWKADELDVFSSCCLSNNYDAPESAQDITAFIMNVDDILIHSKLKPSARPVEAADDPYHLINGADHDCRLMTFKK